MKHRLSASLFALAVLAAGPAAAQDWNLTVSQSATGHRIGKADAPVALIEFMSYTCPHCGQFAVAADGALTRYYVGPGRLSIEYRPMVRDPVDLTVSMLVSCVQPKRFAAAHAAFMERHDGWLVAAQRTPAAQRAVWADAYRSAERRRSIASALELYPMVEPLGLSRVAADRCLANQAKANAMIAAADANRTEFGVTGTPSFALDGILLAGTHDWDSLRPQIDVRLSPPR
jgi:protein-disulfide isomerase